MRWYAQVIGSANVDTTPSFLVHFDSQRYLFNCGEGTQRLFVELGVRAVKIADIFLTRTSWECIGGVPGMILTVADAGVNQLTFHGGPNLAHFLAANRHHVARSAMSVNVNEHSGQLEGELDDEAPIFFQDKNMIVRAVALAPEGYLASDHTDRARHRETTPSTGRRKRSHSSDSSDEETVTKYGMSPAEHRRQIINLMFPGLNKVTALGYVNHESAEALLVEKCTMSATNTASTAQAKTTTTSTTTVANTKTADVPLEVLRKMYHSQLPRTKPVPIALCYVCQGHTVPGRFNPKAAAELGLKPGPLFAELKSGKSVTAPNGTVIYPHQVVGPSRPGAKFIVIDCPGPEYIPSLVNSNYLQKLRSSVDLEAPRCIFYILGEGVLQDPVFQSWMKGFSDATQHIIAAREATTPSIQFHKSAICQIKLNKLDPDIFPLSYYADTPEQPLSTLFPNLKNVVEAESGLICMMEPKPDLDRKEIREKQDFSATGPISQEIDADQSFSAAIKQVHEQVAKASNERDQSDMIGGDIIITTLGTGSALPSKYRNVSATLLTIPEVGTVFLDAGEGTLGQLSRHLGPEDHQQRMSAEECLRQLRCIFVSHLHADHHLGIIRLLRYWKSLRELDVMALGKDAQQEPLYIIGPSRFRTWLYEYNGVENLNLSQVRFINANDLLYNREMPSGQVLKNIEGLNRALGTRAIRTTHVIHCPMAYGISIEHQQGWKLVYSGDTRPCDNLVEMGKDATLLIHEATLEDDMIKEAIEKRHSTTAEAVEIGRRMQAQNVLLTHFSQRYPRVPPLNDPEHRTGVAFDMMSVRLRDLWKIPYLIPGVRALFPEDSEEAKNEDAVSVGASDPSLISSDAQPSQSENTSRRKKLKTH